MSVLGASEVMSGSFRLGFSRRERPWPGGKAAGSPEDTEGNGQHGGIAQRSPWRGQTVDLAARAATFSVEIENKATKGMAPTHDAHADPSRVFHDCRCKP